MGSESLIGKEAVVLREEIKVVEITGEILEDNEQGIIIRHGYRKGVRIEFIPRGKVAGAYIDEKKPPRKANAPKVGAPRPVLTRPETQEPVIVPPENPGVLDDEEFDDASLDEFNDDFN